MSLEFFGIKDYLKYGLIIKNKKRKKSKNEIDSSKYIGPSHKTLITKKIYLGETLNSAKINNANIFFEFDAEISGNDFIHPHLMIIKWSENSEEGPIEGSETRMKFFPSEENKKMIFKIDIPNTSNKYITLSLYQSVNYNCKLKIENICFQFEGTRIFLDQKELIKEKISSTVKWTNQENIISMECHLGKYFTEYPNSLDVSKFLENRRLQKFAEYILLGNIDKYYLNNNQREIYHRNLVKNNDEGIFREHGKNRVLLFSGGEDSTAAFELMPRDTQIFSLLRPYENYRLGNGAKIILPSDKPMIRIIDAVDGLKLTTNFELIGVKAGMGLGFRDNAGYLVMAIIFCESANIDQVGLGSVMEQIYMGSGHKFVDVMDENRPSLSALQFRIRLYNLFGINVIYPTGGSSEVITHEICNQSKLRDLIIPCPVTSEAGKPCGVCFKCFRKFGMDGHLLDNPGNTTIKFLSKIPIKSATSTVYSCHKSGYRNEIISLYDDLDLTWLERYYSDAYEYLLPDDLRSSVLQRYEDFGILPMTKEDQVLLKNVDSVFNNKSYNGAL